MLPEEDMEFLNSRQQKFWDFYLAALEKSKSIADQRSDEYDRETTPTYYRLTPEGMLHEIEKKAGRVRSVINMDWRTTDPKLREQMRKEIPDIINYACFLDAALRMWDDRTTWTGLRAGDEVTIGG